jgi:hypothetical protein
MNDEQLLGKVGSWLKDTDTAHLDVERITARAMAQVPQVRQRGRWWPLPTFDRVSRPTPASGSTVISALKFVTAGVIVGLAGGFLLADTLTTQPSDTVDPAVVTDSPSPMTVDRLLSVAQTEGVEPGVLRVIDDGIRDLGSSDNTSLVSGRDGGIWLLSQDHFLRVGDVGAHEWPAGQAAPLSDFEVALGGTVWTLAQGEDGLSAVHTLAGEQWATYGPASDFRAIEIAHDDTVWAMWQEPDSETVALGQLAGGDRQPVGQWPEGQLQSGDLHLTDTGETWVIGAPEHREGKPWLHRLVGGTLQLEYDGTVVAADVGPDGTVWFVSVDELMRLDGVTEGAEPESWSLPAEMTAEWESASGWTFLPGDAFRATPDGSVWFALRAETGPPLSKTYCAGIVRFDGTTWLGPLLPDRCVESIELAADGSVWLLAHAGESDDDVVDLFVVTPEAAA